MKSGNWIVKTTKDVISTILSKSSNNIAIWKLFWTFNIPPKIRVFHKEVYERNSPEKINLLKRGLPLDPICQRYGKENETLEHDF